ncbi:hypothetical protein B0I37DRAFT_354003 [Chaetomium sp. MPI-CAGE-AT-0009]|nr:hypothetical protein B0I37DRAFT_354003 [Chaetomium sp. MPI-CAGE-AT-0009]
MRFASLSSLSAHVLVACQVTVMGLTPVANLQPSKRGGSVSSRDVSIELYHDDDAARAARQFSCEDLVYGLSAQDCEHMASIGMFAQGQNDYTANGRIWLGVDGPNIFIFVNAAGVPITLVVWYKEAGDDAASFMNVRQPYISFSLPATEDAVGVSVANGVSGGFSGLYNRSTQLSPYGQVSNTLGEFTTGEWATIDVSRLVNMAGNGMLVEVFGEAAQGESSEPDCVTDLQTCAYTCSSAGAQSCGAAGSYELLNCDGPNAENSVDEDGNPMGGCHGWSNGGYLEVALTW